MFEVGVVAHFEAAHRLHGDFGPATRTHGHTYKVEAAARGKSLRGDGTLLDITVLQNALQAVIDDLHFRDLDEISGLQGQNTTAEIVARFIAGRIAPYIQEAELETPSVRVWDSPHAYAEYQLDLTKGR